MRDQSLPLLLLLLISSTLGCIGESPREEEGKTLVILTRHDTTIQELAKEEFLKSETMTIVVQVNGKVRDNVEVPVDIGEEELKEACRTEKVENHIGDKEIRKVIVVPKKLLNFVVK